MLVTNNKLNKAVNLVERQIESKNLEIIKRLNTIDNTLNGESCLMYDKLVITQGLIETVKKQTTELEKLKAIVAELCDYVYKDQKID